MNAAWLLRDFSVDSTFIVVWLIVVPDVILFLLIPHGFLNRGGPKPLAVAKGLYRFMPQGAVAALALPMLLAVSELGVIIPMVLLLFTIFGFTMRVSKWPRLPLVMGIFMGSQLDDALTMHFARYGVIGIMQLIVMVVLAGWLVVVEVRRRVVFDARHTLLVDWQLTHQRNRRVGGNQDASGDPASSGEQTAGGDRAGTGTIVVIVAATLIISAIVLSARWVSPPVVVALGWIGALAVILLEGKLGASFGVPLGFVPVLRPRLPVRSEDRAPIDQGDPWAQVMVIVVMASAAAFFLLVVDYFDYNAVSIHLYPVAALTALAIQGALFLRSRVPLRLGLNPKAIRGDVWAISLALAAAAIGPTLVGPDATTVIVAIGIAGWFTRGRRPWLWTTLVGAYWGSRALGLFDFGFNLV